MLGEDAAVFVHSFENCVVGTYNDLQVALDNKKKTRVNWSNIFY